MSKFRYKYQALYRRLKTPRYAKAGNIELGNYLWDTEEDYHRAVNIVTIANFQLLGLNRYKYNLDGVIVDTKFIKMDFR